MASFHIPSLTTRLPFPSARSCVYHAFASSSKRTIATWSPPRPIRFESRQYRQPQEGIIHIRLSVRYISSGIRKPHDLPPDQKASYDRLRPIVDTFEAPIDWAVAYGSGVMKQAQTKPGDPPSLTDLLLSTSSPVEFHSINLRQNPSHYPLHARLIGAKGVAHIQETWGAGVWYVTDVKINNTSVKYGVISTAALIEDLTQWKTFYISGRLHKPTLPLVSPSSPRTESASPSSSSTSMSSSVLGEALETNRKSALATALLLCPERFEEDYLWEKIAGLSYSGDPRMSIPGGENPEKVRNIVRGSGAREGFREMYGSYLPQRGVMWAGPDATEKSGWHWQDGWKGDGEALLYQPTSAAYQVELFKSLPSRLRQSVLAHYLNDASRELDQDSEKAVISSRIQDPQFRSTISEELRKIIHKPALRQSIKGLFTAGFTKSFWYALAKIRKWLNGRGKK
ncbi:uncharacterized protein I303_102072 [Kwoniella dejecticola CBS 10117]|uniref:Phosphatidate cytidylyltransferase, mitochondrial n=1 Tax=Kwoniella dejecticola CBS 10117 TaxID=1296121 RepID=A0A1A6ABZ4_9TREE|nr:mitochondrial matrix protein import protein [Kwoniella dejecticola CBS 10117]OBR87579.1 mitochondrial matrix protein import protein [Kwoniella dejecticola CBS 10117]